MTIERFTKEKFEEALPRHRETGEPLFVPDGVKDGEYQYFLKVKEGVFICIRSSVRPDGVAADTGLDSIRAWLVDGIGRPLGSKVISYTTRCPGWQDRLTRILKELWARGNMVNPCPDCGKLMGIFKVKKEGKNRGRLFTKCFDHGHFQWLDEEPKKAQKRPTIEAASRADIVALLARHRTIKARVGALKEQISTDQKMQLYTLVHVFNNQTEDEKVGEYTYHRNGVGFTGVAAEFLCSLAKQFLNRGSLSPKQIKYLPKKLPCYAAQLERDLRPYLG
jgi:hypothetical protein